MAHLSHPAPGMVVACPACGVAGRVRERSDDDSSWNRQDDKPFRCDECQTSLEEVDEREAVDPGENPLSPAGRAAIAADPDSVGGRS